MELGWSFDGVLIKRCVIQPRQKQWVVSAGLTGLFSVVNVQAASD